MRQSIVLFLILISQVAFCQYKNAMGYIPSEDELKIPRYPSYFGLNENERVLPKAFSLRDYCPTAGDQNPYGTCSSFALGYSGYTVLRAIRDNIIDKANINDNIYSPLYIHNQYARYVKADACDSGAAIKRLTDILNDYGICKLSDYEYYPKNKCGLQSTINGSTINKSLLNKNSLDIHALWVQGDKNDAKLTIRDRLERIKKAISNYRPIVLSIIAYDQINGLNVFHSTYEHQPNEIKEGYHAVLCIGYDDEKQQIEILNSWGTQWGNNGLFFINYSDIPSFVRSSFEISLKSSMISVSKPYNIKAQLTINTKQIDKKFMNMPFYVANGIYNIDGMFQKKFNIQLTTGENSFKYYIVSLDPNVNKANSKKILFPFDHDTLSSGYYSVPSNFYLDHVENLYRDATTEPFSIQTIPCKTSPRNGLIKSNEATEPLIILISRVDLNIKGIVDKLEYGQNYTENIRNAIKTYHPQLRIPYKFELLSNEIGFDGNLSENEVLPLIIYLNK